ncbi:hypothetical protein ACWDAZ_42595, partial [Streptomyces sp. NPDC001215]
LGGADHHGGEAEAQQREPDGHDAAARARLELRPGSRDDPGQSYLVARAPGNVPVTVVAR